MIQRNKVYYAVIGLVLAILTLVWLNQKIQIDIATNIIIGLVYWAIFMADIMYLCNAIKGPNTRNDFLDFIWISAGATAITTMLIGIGSNSNILLIVWEVSIMVFLILGGYRAGEEKRSIENIEKKE